MTVPAQDASTAEPSRRVFFAAPLHDATRRALVAACAEGSDDRLRWLPSAGWHLTLRFVGDVPAERVEALASLVPAVAAGHAPFHLAFEKIAPFPDSRRPAVLAAVAEAVAPGLAIVGNLEARCRALGLAPERRPWRPHVSLARFRGRERQGLPELSLQLEMPVATLALMESLPDAVGRRYVVMTHCALDGTTPA